jgi:taurine dioxygenase
VNVEPVTASIGVVVSDVGLADLDAEGIEAVRAIVHEHEVGFFPGQDLDDDQHLRCAQAFGPVRVFPIAALFGATEPAVTAIVDTPDDRPVADDWHTDVTWMAEPPDYAMLRSVTSPKRGGDTMWASMTSAYDALSESFRAMVSDLRVVHDNTSFLEAVKKKVPPDVYEKHRIDELRTLYPPVTHPLIRTHPVTGRRALFLGGYFMRRIEGLEETESDAMLGFLRGHMDQPRFHVRWRWSEGDVAIWDERSTNHRAVADHWPQQREVRRCEIGGSVPE